MPSLMSRSFLARYVSPWVLRRDREQQQRVASLRQRDGDNCRRCRRPIRFDFPSGHDKSPNIEEIAPADNDAPLSLDNQCLCHVRCNSAGADHTPEVTERIRRRNEAALLSRKRG